MNANDSFTLQYSAGSSIVLSITYMLIDSLSLILGGRNKYSFYVLSTDTFLLGTSILALVSESSTFFWIIHSFLFSAFMMFITVASTYRAWNMLKIKGKWFAVILNLNTFCMYFLGQLSLREIIPSNIGVAMLFAVPASPLLMFIMLATKIVSTVESNPRYKDNVKQMHVRKIYRTAAAYVTPFIILSIFLIFYGILTGKAEILDYAYTSLPFIKLATSAIHLLLIANKAFIGDNYQLTVAGNFTTISPSKIGRNTQ